jgi:hypothetical protein
VLVDAWAQVATIECVTGAAVMVGLFAFCAEIMLVQKRPPEIVTELRELKRQ